MELNDLRLGATAFDSSLVTSLLVEPLMIGSVLTEADALFEKNPVHSCSSLWLATFSGLGTYSPSFPCLLHRFHTVILIALTTPIVRACVGLVEMKLVPKKIRCR